MIAFLFYLWSAEQWKEQPSSKYAAPDHFIPFPYDKAGINLLWCVSSNVVQSYEDTVSWNHLPVLCSIGAKFDVQEKKRKGFRSIHALKGTFGLVCRIQALHLLPFKSSKPAFSPVLVFLRVMWMHSPFSRNALVRNSGGEEDAETPTDEPALL